MDILKHKGYKISALDVESTLLAHAGVRECAVVGLPHATFGQELAAVVVAAEGYGRAAEVEGTGGTGAEGWLEWGLLAWARDRMPPYQVPTKVFIVDAIPRNAMGKVNKRALAARVLDGTIM